MGNKNLGFCSVALTLVLFQSSEAEAAMAAMRRPAVAPVARPTTQRPVVAPVRTSQVKAPLPGPAKIERTTPLTPPTLRRVAGPARPPSSGSVISSSGSGSAFRGGSVAPRPAQGAVNHTVSMAPTVTGTYRSGSVVGSASPASRAPSAAMGGIGSRTPAPPSHLSSVSSVQSSRVTPSVTVQSGGSLVSTVRSSAPSVTVQSERGLTPSVSPQFRTSSTPSVAVQSRGSSVGSFGLSRPGALAKQFAPSMAPANTTGAQPVRQRFGGQQNPGVKDRVSTPYGFSSQPQARVAEAVMAPRKSGAYAYTGEQLSSRASRLTPTSAAPTSGQRSSQFAGATAEPSVALQSRSNAPRTVTGEYSSLMPATSRPQAEGAAQQSAQRQVASNSGGAWSSADFAATPQMARAPSKASGPIPTSSFKFTGGPDHTGVSAGKGNVQFADLNGSPVALKQGVAQPEFLAAQKAGDAGVGPKVYGRSSDGRMVMEQVQGVTLEKMMAQKFGNNSQATGRLDSNFGTKGGRLAQYANDPQLGPVYKKLAAMDPALMPNDMNSSNIMVAKDGRVLLLDYDGGARGGSASLGAGSGGYSSPYSNPYSSSSSPWSFGSSSGLANNSFGMSSPAGMGFGSSGLGYSGGYSPYGSGSSSSGFRVSSSGFGQSFGSSSYYSGGEGRVGVNYGTPSYNSGGYGMSYGSPTYGAGGYGGGYSAYQGAFGGFVY